jgi:peptidoglycan hydrolase-like protein with peptidoglycan-binding domain
MPATQALPILREGDTGYDVRWAQYRLTRQTLQYTDIDGIFGPFTRTGVVEFQKSYGLDPDGVIGPKTWEKLRGDSERPPTLKRGSSGPTVASLQRALNNGHGSFTPPDLQHLDEDGDFGPLTEAAVKATQIWVGLPGDGIVGMATWAVPIGAAGQVIANLCDVPGPG